MCVYRPVDDLKSLPAILLQIPQILMPVNDNSTPFFQKLTALSLEEVCTTRGLSVFGEISGAQ